jgi:hypothetical protein
VAALQPVSVIRVGHVEHLFLHKSAAHLGRVIELEAGGKLTEECCMVGFWPSPPNLWTHIKDFRPCWHDK